MDDKFLYQLREQPESGFANKLHQKLSQNPVAPAQGIETLVHSLFGNKRLLQAAVFLVIVGVAVMAISPARAFVASLIMNIAGLSFDVTSDYPGDNYPGDEETIEPQIMTLDEALAAFPYSIQLPPGIPPEYVLNEETVRVYVGEDAGPFANTIELEWQWNAQGNLMLRITDQDPDTGEIVAPDSLEEIPLDETHSAALIRGGWDADQKAWSNDIGVIRLRWIVDDLTYDLMGADQELMVAIAQSTLK